MNKWEIKTADPKHINALTKGTDLTPFCAELLAVRGVDSPESAAEYLRVDDTLSDPFLLSDMLSATNRIHAAIEGGQRIAIYGDYDCDGVVATVMLYTYLECLGADVTYYIPEREGEGYGLSANAVQKLHEDGVQLIITVDNGISAHEEAKLIAELGMELIITDHHQPSETLPDALAVVNPHRRDDLSPFKPLCGAGVALKLICALEDGDYDTTIEQFGDLAAIATIGDIVSLTGENRSIVRQGLKLLANTEKPGLIALMEACKISSDRIGATAVAFGIVPRINAAGRFGSASDAVKLLLCEDEEEAIEMAQALCQRNTERQESERGILEQAFAQIAENPRLLHGRVLILAGKDWSKGVIGIVAAKLLDRFGKPVIVLSISDGVAHGSARSIEGFSLYKALCACDDLLERFGGHTRAAGLTVLEENIPALRERMEQYAAQKYSVMPVATTSIDKVIGAGELTLQNAQSLALLEPFGEGNPRPVFALMGAVLEEVKPLKEGRFISLNLSHAGQRLRAVCFSMRYEEFTYPIGAKLDFLCDIDVNEYNNKSNVSVKIKEIRPSGFAQDKYFAAKAVYERILRGEGYDPRLKKRVVPTREDAAAVYKMLTDMPKQIDTLYRELQGLDITYAKLRLALDILQELKLIEINAAQDNTRRLPVKGKVDFSASKILASLQ